MMPPSKKTDVGLIFDIDGVLLDVSTSYNEMIKEVVMVESLRLLSRQECIEDYEIREFRDIGGFNNDFDLAYAAAFRLGILCILEKEYPVKNRTNKHNTASRKKAPYDSGLQPIVYNWANYTCWIKKNYHESHGKIEESVMRNYMERLFSDGKAFSWYAEELERLVPYRRIQKEGMVIYAGKMAPLIYNISEEDTRSTLNDIQKLTERARENGKNLCSSRINLEENNTGLFITEKTMIDPQWSPPWGIPFCIYTGRNRGEVKLAKKLLPFLEKASAVISQDDGFSKPDHAPITELSALMNTRKIIYFGDTYSDALSTRKFNLAFQNTSDIRFCLFVQIGKERAPWTAPYEIHCGSVENFFQTYFTDKSGLEELIQKSYALFLSEKSSLSDMGT